MEHRDHSTLEVAHEYPGLEVPQEYPGLEVAPESYNQPIPQQFANDKLLSPAPAPPALKKSRKRLWWAIGGAIAVLVIVGAVVGGVVGSRKNNSDSPGSEPGETLKSVRPNSRLAVTGYRGNGDFRARLFYQGPDNVLRSSDFSSVTQSWTKPMELGDLAPIAKTPLGAATWMKVTPPEMYLYYVDEASLLRGQRFRDGLTPSKGASSDINRFPLKVDRGSRLAAYFPFVLTEDVNGKLRWIHWKNDKWYNRTFDGDDATAAPGSGMVVLPVAVTYVDAAGFLYRDKGGQLTPYTTNTSVHDDRAWSYGQLNAQIPAESAIGAFTYGRKDDLVNTYILYQDTDGVLQVRWQSNTSGWMGPQTYPALADADMGTDITCLTQPAWDETKVTLSSATDMNRCYFQSGGKVKEVRFDGGDWKDLGFIPMP